MKHICPLCAAEQTVFYHRDRCRNYFQCRYCHLVFVAPTDFLSIEQEKAEYDLHQNQVDDPAYRCFLSRLYEPLSTRLAPGSQGLDFGCGPGPALATMFEEAGYTMSLYDIFYQPALRVFERRYDFISATEVVEHLHRPGRELARLWDCLHPGGWLGVMTKLVCNPQAFAHWHYKNDLTHVSFFSIDCWQWWARQQKAQLVFEGTDVILLRKIANENFRGL